MKAATPRPIHYSGGVLYRVGQRGSAEHLPGWPACCSGDRARKIAADGEQSDTPAKVTCKRCLDLLRRHREDAAELGAYRAGFCALLLLRDGHAVLETADEATLRVGLMPDEFSGEVPKGALTPREAVRLGRVLVAWGDARGGSRGR